MDRESFQERFGITGTSPGIRQVIDRVRQVARTDISVLIEGESGVGKELVANALHEMSGRRHNPHVIVNCGAIPEGLIESELFGAEKGAYTGAVDRRTGYFEEADRGTIFLDEIGEMPAAAQVRLLRVLETGHFSRVGSSTIQKSDVRIVAATNKDLGKEVQAGRFREDLYYRLSTVVIKVPPLRERREDILPIFQTFLHSFAQKYNTPMRRLDASAEDLLTRYRWPGNVRELRNVAEQCTVLLRENIVSAEAVRPFLRGVTAGGRDSLLPVPHEGGASGTSETRERELVYRALFELKMEVSEMRRDMARMTGDGGYAVSRQYAESEGIDPRDLVVVRRPDQDDFSSFVEDVSYEIENDDDAPVRHMPVRASTPLGNGRGDARGDARDVEGAADDEPLPTIEDAERELIMKALRRFEGNRRQTAKALGISERTLYRKLKDFDEAS